MVILEQNKDNNLSNKYYTDEEHKVYYVSSDKTKNIQFSSFKEQILNIFSNNNNFLNINLTNIDNIYNVSNIPSIKKDSVYVKTE